MPKLSLTDRTVRSLRVEGDGRVTYWDEAGPPGFGLRVYGSGRKAFFLRYRVNGRRRRVTLGTYPALSLANARKKAQAELGNVAIGEDPAAARQAARRAHREAPTFEELAEEYLERHAKRHKRRRSWKEDERQLEKDVLPAWRHRKAEEIRRRDVLELLDGIVDRGAPIMANRTRALLSKVFNVGLERGIVELNPVHGVPRPAKERSRERVLSEREIRKVWEATDSERPLMGATFRLRLLTAQRGVEVLSMRHGDLDGSWWTIPADRFKSETDHRVPLSPQAIVLLEDIRNLSSGSPWVFPSPRGGHLRWIQSAASRIREASGCSWTPHDLRRTAASHMAGMGTPRLVISKILGHAESGATSVYDRHSYDAEKREALEAWGARVEAIVSVTE